MEKKYIIYARKSSESDDRQALSLESQIEECQKVSELRGLKIARVFKESKSAKYPGRPLFNKMLDMLENDSYAGVVCWAVNRLSRNARDGGAIQWLMDDGDIEIITPYQTYNKANSSLQFKIETGQAEQFSKDLSIIVKRGNRTHFSRGIWLGEAPPGYLNKQDDMTGLSLVIKDPERFDLIRKMWDLALEGYSVPRICKIANDQWGYRTKKTRKRSGSKLKDSVLYRIFRNPFYYGLMVRNVDSELMKVKGNFEPMIDKSHFDKVQEMLGFVNKEPVEHAWGINGGLIKCGECGRAITVEKHTKVYKSNTKKEYVYARCTKRNVKCSQGYVPVNDLIKQVKNVLEQVSISPKFVEWILKQLRKENKSEEKIIVSQRKMLTSQINEIQRKQKRLLDLFISSETVISESEYKERKQELAIEKEKLTERLDALEYKSKSWFELAEKSLNFAANCLERFENADAHGKHQILRTIGGSNLSLKDGKLSFEPVMPFFLLQKNSETIAAFSTGGPGGDRTLDAHLKRVTLYH